MVFYKILHENKNLSSIKELWLTYTTSFYILVTYKYTRLHDVHYLPIQAAIANSALSAKIDVGHHPVL